jgi:hypothetical protein
VVLKIALEIEIYTNNNQISSAAAKIRSWKHPVDGLLPASDGKCLYKALRSRILQAAHISLSNQFKLQFAATTN